jgi:hypothetical protein
VYLIPLAKGSKKPLAGPDWHERVTDDPRVHEEWRRSCLNFGFVLEENKVVCADFDDKAAARQFWKDHFRELVFNCVVETLRGAHFYWAGKTQTRKFPSGDLKGNGFMTYPPSRVQGHTYRFVLGGPETELLPFPDHLFPKQKKEVVSKIVHDVRAYVARIESYQGRNGSAGLVRAIARARDAGLTEAQATILILEWNQGSTVDPKWSDEEIARAVSRVFKQKGES